MNAALTVARKEFCDGLRNRWVTAITFIFVVFAVGLAYFGASASGMVGFTSLSTTIVSLASLAVFVIPLIALLLAYDALVGEEENGTLLLLLTYPITRTQLLGGKFLGQGAILALSTMVGFGLAGILIAVFSRQAVAAEVAQAFGFFIFSATLLGGVFIAIGMLLSVLVSEKPHAAGLALIVWFLFVLIFDLSLLGLLVLTEGRIGTVIFPYLLLLNPTDVFRLANLAGFEAAQVQAGLLSIAIPSLLSPSLLVAVLGVWVVVPLAVAAWLFKRREV